MADPRADLARDYPWLPASVGPGWACIVRDLAAGVERVLGRDALLAGEVLCVRCGEERGVLAVHLSAEPPEMAEAISTAVAASARTCEECGAHGVLRMDLPWRKTLCDRHHAAIREARARTTRPVPAAVVRPALTGGG